MDFVHTHTLVTPSFVVIALSSDALGEYKCDTRMFVEDVLVIVNLKTLKG